MTRKLHHVSIKAAVYSPDRSKILVIHAPLDDKYKSHDWGLPGGHLDDGETIDHAIERELMEECGITVPELKKTNFFAHSNGKIVLAYTGVAKTDELDSQQDNLEGFPEWLTRQEFERIEIEPGYRKLVLDNWV